ncbi:MAG: alkaline phosphatase family protein, partial [Chloroflexia bacterium]
MSRRLWIRLARVLLIPLLLGATGYGAQMLGMLAFDQFLNYTGLPLEPPAPGAAGPTLCERVVVVVVDGLREDTSHQMPTLEELRAAGADLPSWTQVPSLSLPGYTVLGTGAYPDLSGVTTNWYEGTVRVDSLFVRAREAGKRTALVSEPSWHMLYGPWIDVDYAGRLLEAGDEPPESAWSTEALGREGQRVLQEEDAALVYIYFGETDKAGESYGGTSPEYLQAARNVDAQIASIAGWLDWSRDTLVVTADHGMI